MSVFSSPRLRSCEAAAELLAKFRNGHDNEKIEVQRIEDTLRSSPIEPLGPSEAELELERLRVSVAPCLSLRVYSLSTPTLYLYSFPSPTHS